MRIVELISSFTLVFFALSLLTLPPSHAIFIQERKRYCIVSILNRNEQFLQQTPATDPECETAEVAERNIQ
jgi:hypothetical protein